MTHYEPATLFGYLDGISPMAATIDAHVAWCGECATQVAESRRFLETLRNERAWEELPAVHFADIQEVATLAARLELEDEVAPALCDEILASPEAWWLQHVRKTAGTRTAGIIKLLLERMRPMKETSPATALQMTHLAVQLAEELDPTAYPPECIHKLHGQALRNRALMLSFIGHYHEALACADRAKELFDRVAGTSFDLARLAMVKATALQYVDRVDEGAALVHEAAKTFLAHGEHLWYVDARITEGAVIYNSGAVERARKIWQSIEQHPLLDDVRRVRIAHNIALCHADLGHPAQAMLTASRCVAEYARLGMTAERTRSRTILARAMIANGQPHDAIPVLRQVRREYSELSMYVEAGVSALELAEALLATNRPYEVPTICREIITEFTNAGMRTAAITALAYLNEALALGKATAPIIRDAQLSLRRHCAERPRLSAPAPVNWR